MIIMTRRSLFGLAIDTTLTALGWVGFFYLLASGVLTIVESPYANPGSSMVDPSSPAISTLISYMLVAALNALVLVLWARCHKTFFRKFITRHKQILINQEAVASHFSLSPVQLHVIQDSRVTVIHHSPDGGIAHLEAGPLYIEPGSDTGIYEAARAA